MSRCATLRRRAAAATLAFLLLPATAGLANPLKILAFGDSLVAGYGLDAEESFPVQLEAALQAKGHDVKVINGGVSGDTTAAGRARLAWSLAERPDAVIVELGANDALRGLDPAKVYENLNAILTTLRGEGLPVLLAGMYALRNLGPEYRKEFDAVYPRLAEEHGVPLYPFFLDGVVLNRELNQFDGLHPNARGVAVIVERILPHVIELIERAEAHG
jgi:acyl-CoA thioesterase-1